MQDKYKKNLHCRFEKLTFHVQRSGSYEALHQLSVDDQWKQSKLDGTGSEYVFPARSKDTSYDMRKPFKEALGKSGITNFTWHDFRHSVAVYMVTSAVPEDMILKIMGWKTRSMITRYTHYSAEQIKEFQQKALLS